MQDKMIMINRNDCEDSKFYKNFFKAIDEFPINQFDNDLDYKIQRMVVIANKIYQNLKKELAGIFTLNEALLIIAVFNGHIYTPELSDKTVIIMEIEDAIEYSRYDELYDVDKEELLAKLEKLTETQSFVVIGMVNEYWSFNAKHTDNHDKYIRRIFMIND